MGFSVDLNAHIKTDQSIQMTLMQIQIHMQMKMQIQLQMPKKNNEIDGLRDSLHLHLFCQNIGIVGQQLSQYAKTVQFVFIFTHQNIRFVIRTTIQKMLS